MQLGMKIPHTYNALYVMISNLNVECNLQRDFFNTIGGMRKVCLSPAKSTCRYYNCERPRQVEGSDPRRYGYNNSREIRRSINARSLGTSCLLVGHKMVMSRGDETSVSRSCSSFLSFKADFVSKSGRQAIPRP